MSATLVIKRGMRIVWKPEFCDAGDAKYTFVAETDADLIDGSFYVVTIESTAQFFLRPRQLVYAHMAASAEVLLPVATITFLGLGTKGARVQMRRTLGDRELSVTEETIARSTFRQLFRRSAVDCKVGDELRSGVEFPEPTSKGAAHDVV